MTRSHTWSVGLLLLALGCNPGASPSAAHAAPPSQSSRPAPTSQPAARGDGTRAAPPPAAGQAVAVFAGGCFWCMEKPFEALPGVLSVLSGYTGGRVPGATYEEVSGGGTGHYEAVRVLYDPSRASYETLLEVFVRNVDPTQANGQFCDHGPQYRSAVFVHDDAQRKLAQAALDGAKHELGRPVVTEILSETTFYVAEDYHQDFYKTHSAHYERYRRGCGRDARLRELWGAAGGH